MGVRLFVVIVLTVCSFSGFATEYDNVTIKRLMLHRNFNDVVFIDLDIESPTRLECHENNEWDYVLNISDDFGRAIYSTLLAMKASQSSGLFTGNGLCNVYDYAESLKRVQFK